MNYQLSFLHNRCLQALLSCLSRVAGPCPAQWPVGPNRVHCKWDSSRESSYLSKSCWGELDESNFVAFSAPGSHYLITNLLSLTAYCKTVSCRYRTEGCLSLGQLSKVQLYKEKILEDFSIHEAAFIDLHS